MKPQLLALLLVSFPLSQAYGALETKYLLFQLFTNGADEKLIPSLKSHEEILSAAQSIIAAVGSTGNDARKLGVALGPLTLATSDAETIKQIHFSFQLARQKNLAVAFHLDEQMFWRNNPEITAEKANLEWLDWKGTLNTGRRLDWGAAPAKIEPQLCLNSLKVKATAAKRARLIGAKIREEVSALKKEGRAALFAGVIAGWESQIGRDFATGNALGYCALSNRGYSESKRPKDFDAEIIAILREYVELWAKELAASGVEKNKIYSHIAFTSQGLQSVFSKLSSVAFSKFYGPGFTTYPEAETFKMVRQELSRHQNPDWISAEGTNVVPNGFPGEATMETYLARIFNHNGRIATIFSWGVGSEAEKEKNFFRRATEGPEAIGAYRKFLSGDKLVEKERSGQEFSEAIFRKKMQRIQKEAPAWAQRTGRASEIEPLMEKLDGLLKSLNLEEADQVATQILLLIGA